MQLKNIINHETKSVNSAAIILAIASLVSALLGLIRDRLLAGTFGAGRELDIYYIAFKIPDFISIVLIIGAISAAITPIFSHYLVRSKKEAFDFLSNLINVFLLFLIILSLILIIFVPQLLYLIAPGFSVEEREMAAVLTRIMFLSPILLGISNIISSVLRVFQRFLVTSIAPILYNVGIIIGILFFVPIAGLKGLAWGVVLGAFFHLVFQIPTLIQLGFKFQKKLKLRDPGVKKAIELTIPRSIGLATTQINLIIISAIASILSSGSIAIMNLADNLSRPLYTFIAVSLATAAFPALTLAFSKQEKNKFQDIFSATFKKIFWLTFSLGIILFLFRDLIVKIILHTGKFALTDVRLTAICFGIFAVGIFAQGLVLLIAKSFYALHDTKTPTIISILSAIFNIVLCFGFIKLFSFPNAFSQFFLNLLNINSLQLTSVAAHPFIVKFLGIYNLTGLEVIALPLAISVSAVFQFIFLYILFCRKKEKVFQEQSLSEIN